MTAPRPPGPAFATTNAAAIYRIVAWLFHDAAFAADGIAVEVVVGSLLLFAGARLAKV